MRRPGTVAGYHAHDGARERSRQLTLRGAAAW